MAPNGNGTTELTKREKPPVLQAVEAALSQFAGRLPRNLLNGMTPERFMLGLATAIQKTPALLDCDPKSVILAGYEAAELGINLNPSLGLGYIIPYGRVAQFQLGYRGMIQKTYETGAISGFFAEVVYQNDHFNRQFAPKRNLFHAPPEGSERGEPIGAYALITHKDGTIDYEYMTADQINRHRKHSKQPDSLMWKTFWEEGWRKTPTRVLWKRVALSSPELERLAEVIARDAERDSDPEPTGRIELEPSSPLLENRNSAATPQAQEQEPQTNGANGHAAPKSAKADIFFQVDKHYTIVTGNTYVIKDDLPKLGARWDEKARIWTMPSSRTHELLAACEKRGVKAVEVDGRGAPTLQAGEVETEQEQKETLFDA